MVNEQKGIYLTVEDKWYSFWDSVDRVLPVSGAIDAIDKVIPSMILFILVIILLVAFGVFLLLSTNQVFDATFTIQTTDGRPVNDTLLNVKLLENGELVKTLEQRTDSSGVVTFSAIKMGQEIVFDINLSRGTYSGSFAMNDTPLDEVITLEENTTPINLSPLTKKILVKESSGFLARDAIPLTFGCDSSSNLPTPTRATFSGTFALEVVEPVGCHLTATVNHPKYKQKTYLVQSTSYDLFLEPIEPVGTQLKVIIKSGGFPVSGTNFRINVTGDNTYELATNGESQAITNVNPGSYLITVTDPRGNFGLVSRNVVVGSTTEVQIDVFKTVKARATIKVVNSVTGSIVPNATVNLRDAFGRELASQTTDNLGVTVYSFTDLGDYAFIAKRAGDLNGGYLPKESKQTISTDINFTMALDAITAANAGRTTVIVMDQDKVPVANAKVMLKYKDNDGLVELMQEKNYGLTDANGEVSLIAGQPVDLVYAYAIKGPFVGSSIEKKIVVESINKFNVEMEIGSATVKINVLDETGNKIDATAEVQLVSGVSADDHGLAGLIPIENGYAARSIKAGQKVYIKVMAETFENYYTAPIDLWPNRIYDIEITMLKNIAEPKILSKGVYNADGAPVQTMAAGKKYYAKFYILSNNAYNNVKFNFRVGKETLLENDIMQIDEVEASGLKSQARGVTYDPEKGYDFDGAVVNRTDGLSKWVEMEWDSFGKGLREVKVWFMVKRTAAPNQELQFFYRGKFDNIRRPESTAVQDFYAGTYFSDKYYAGTETICTFGFCANSEWLYSTKDKLYVDEPFAMKQTTNYNYHVTLLNNSGIDYGTAKKPVTLSISIVGDEAGDKKIKIKNYEIKDATSRLTNNTPIYSIENQVITSLEKNSTIDMLFGLEGTKMGAETLKFELKSEGKIIYTKETEISVVREKDFNVGISPQFIPALINTMIEVTVADEKGEYLPGATVNVYAKEPGFEQYPIDSKETDRMGRAEVKSGAHFSGTKVLIEVIKEGYSRQMFSTTVSDSLILAVPEELYVELNTFSKREEVKTIEFANLSRSKMILRQIILDSKFKDLVNEDALKANFEELTLEQKTILPEDTLEIDLLKIRLANGITEDNFIEPITVQGNVKLVFEEPESGLNFNIEMPLSVGISSSANPDHECIIIKPTSKTSMTTEKAQVRFNFELINACTSDGVGIPLQSLVVYAPADIPGIAEISIRNSTGSAIGITALDGGRRKLVDNIRANEKLFGEITFAPGEEAVGKSVQLAVSYEAKFKDITIKSSPQTVNYTTNVVNLKECMSISADTFPVGYAEKAQIKIDTTACLGQMIDIILCMEDSGCSGGTDGKIVLSKKAFTLQNKIETIDTYNPTYPGTYGVTIHARTRGTAGFSYIGEVPVSFLEPESKYFNLNKFELMLVGTGAKDSIMLTNKMVSETVNVKADECVWGKKDAEFNWASALTGAMMGAMLGNLIGSAYHPGTREAKDARGSSGGKDVEGQSPSDRASEIKDLQSLESRQGLNRDQKSRLNSLVETQNTMTSASNSFYGGLNSKYTGMHADTSTTLNEAFGTSVQGYTTTVDTEMGPVKITNIGNNEYFFRSNSIPSGRTYTGDVTLGTVGSQFGNAYANSSGLRNFWNSSTMVFRTTPNTTPTLVKPGWEPVQSGFVKVPVPGKLESIESTGIIPLAALINAQENALNRDSNKLYLAAGGSSINWVQISLTIIGAVVGGWLMGDTGYKCDEHFAVVPMDDFVILLQGTTVQYTGPTGAVSEDRTIPSDAGELKFSLDKITPEWNFEDAQYGAEETVALNFENNGINEPVPRYGIFTVSATVHNHGSIVHKVGESPHSSTGEFDYDVFCKNNAFGNFWIGSESGQGDCGQGGRISENPYSQKYHLRVISGEPKNEESYIKKATTCYMGALTGATGKEALPKVKLDWSWGGIQSDTCDYTNPDHVYCDGTQFMISLTKKLSQLQKFMKTNGAKFNCPPDEIENEVKRAMEQVNSKVNNVPDGYIGISDMELNLDVTTGEVTPTLKISNKSGKVETSYISFAWKGSGEATPEYPNNVIEWDVPIGDSQKVLDTVTVTKFEGVYYFTAVMNGPMGDARSLSRAFLYRDKNEDCWMPQTTDSIAGLPGLTYYVAAMNNPTYTEGISDPAELYNHINFGAYLTKEAFSEDFLRDFKEYYGKGILQIADPDEKAIVDYLTSGNFKIKKKFSGENTIEPGLYDIWVRLNAKDKFLVIDGNNTNITVELLLIKKPSVDSPFYMIPFDGKLGEKGGRQGYGAIYQRGEGENDIEISNYNQNGVYTFYNAASNGVMSVTTKTTTSFEGVNSSVSTRGQLGAVNVYGTNAEMVLTPNYATPVILKNPIEGTEGSIAFSVENPNRAVVTRGNIAYWTGAAKSKDYFGANAVEMYYNSPDYRLSKLGENTFGFEYRNISKKGTMYLKTTLFTPVDQAAYMLTQKNNTTTFWTPDNSFSETVDLKGISGMTYNSSGDYINSLQDLFTAVENNEVCLSNDGSSTTFWWNPVATEGAIGSTGKSLYQEELTLVGIN